MDLWSMEVYPGCPRWYNSRIDCCWVTLHLRERLKDAALPGIPANSLRQHLATAAPTAARTGGRARPRALAPQENATLLLNTPGPSRAAWPRDFPARPYVPSLTETEVRETVVMLTRASARGFSPAATRCPAGHRPSGCF